MKKILFLLSMTLVFGSMPGVAQQVNTGQQNDSASQNSNPNAPSVLIGFVSYDAALKSMPQYAVVQEEMDTLQQAYNAELQRVEQDFNQKYEAFLDGRKDFPRTILLKRQTELQQLLERNVEFKQKSRQELEQIRQEKLAPLHARLSMAISAVARRHQLAVVVNTDSNACPFIDPALAIDLNDEVRLQLETPQP